MQLRAEVQQSKQSLDKARHSRIIPDIHILILSSLPHLHDFVNSEKQSLTFNISVFNIVKMNSLLCMCYFPALKGRNCSTFGGCVTGQRGWFLQQRAKTGDLPPAGLLNLLIPFMLCFLKSYYIIKYDVFFQDSESNSQINSISFWIVMAALVRVCFHIKLLLSDIQTYILTVHLNQTDGCGKKTCHLNQSPFSSICYWLPSEPKLHQSHYFLAQDVKNDPLIYTATHLVPFSNSICFT